MTLCYIGPGPGFAVQAPFLLILLGLVTALAALLTFPLRRLFRRRRARGKSLAKRVIVVGLDGLEPSRVERLVQAGELLNLRKLNSYQRLATTCPPLSPVAWSTFATGVNPGRHGVFGFLHRDRHHQPYLAFSSVEKGRPRFLRKSQSFWQVLGEHGVFSHVIRVPVSWPPEKFHGALLSAMGAPDLRGTQGTYTLFGLNSEELKSGEFCCFRREGEALVASLPGPEGNHLEVRLQDRLLLCGKESVTLQEEVLSPYIRLKFGRVRGLARFLLLGPERLYMTPIQIDPGRPVLPLSWPSAYSVALARILGDFATCGLAEDTGAREDGVLSQQAYLDQAYAIHEERKTQFFHALRRTREGLCAVVFDGPDRIQHMVKDEKVLDQLYREMDELVGETLARSGPDDVVLVLSDHGFKPLARCFDVNAWLHQEGYLKVDDQGQIDWSQTRAHALGLCGIYLNRKDRYHNGWVDQAAPLLQELRERLLDLLDPVTEESFLEDVFAAESIYQGPYLDRAPDLILAYRPGYRTAKSAARGEVGKDLFSDNDSLWCRDHCFHPDLVPGVLFSSIPLQSGARLHDLAPTVLELFGVTPPDYIEGRSLLCAT